jgi:hypothetical protein
MPVQTLSCTALRTVVGVGIFGVARMLLRRALVLPFLLLCVGSGSSQPLPCGPFTPPCSNPGPRPPGVAGPDGPKPGIPDGWWVLRENRPYWDNRQTNTRDLLSKDPQGPVYEFKWPPNLSRYAR